MTKSKEVIQQWIDTILNEGINLSKWEEEFVGSVAEQFERRGSISDKQEDILERIYVEKTPN